ncbi:RrF2 family transcriptional regulator [Lutispora thermophila]|uniref:Transcriptional regulator, BadM/Rrf2 family n=1 Tax=Lutispora thermophila DSM 19022 TaxID=1122184 RepID=A0A1M6FE38_9FIRM|nr:Rrf2 family transcriptional regulator [Lutispora thermophila]SHI95906.1 transcriptional regulator, BadM/Rrf2 family [Lutispora thermophila DSM 19022]
MKISTKGRYGLRAMVDLAHKSVSDHVPLKSIAESQNISEGYLEHVFSTLKKAGLVKSIKGPQGGYILADDPSNITVGAVLRVLEGDLSIVDDNTNTDGDNPIERCIKFYVWKKIDQCINSIVDDITLEDLVFEYKKMVNEETDMYYI